MKRLPVAGDVRVPRIRMLSADADPAADSGPGTTQAAPQHAGTALPGCIEASVTSNAHYQADKWSATLALNAPGAHTLDWWGEDARKGMLFDVRVSLDGDERSLILGEADSIDADPWQGTVRIEGRDLTSRLVDNRIQEALQNRTASEVATLLATRRGLKPVVTATTTPVSRFYAADHDRVQHDQFSGVSTEWDLLCKLAQFEGFDVFVQGRELHFQPQTDPAKAEPWGVRADLDAGTSNVIGLKFRRSLTLAKDVIVVVRSVHSGQGRMFSRSSPPGKGNAKAESGKAQRYVFTRPNLTEDQAQKLADSMRADITKHERNIQFSCAGELEMTARDVILLSGCGSWSQRYFVNTVTRTVAHERGFEMAVTAKNHFVESQSAL